MPSPSTPRRTSKRPGSNETPTKPKFADIVKPLGPLDTNPVRDRVRQWQAQGGGVITASDIVVVEEKEREPVCQEKTPQKSDNQTPTKPAVQNGAKKSPSKSPVSPQARNARTRTKTQAGGWVRSKSGTAPKKRVVSDTNWRKDKEKSPQKIANSSTDAGEPIKSKDPPEDVTRLTPVQIPNDPAVQKTKAERTAIWRATVGSEGDVESHSTSSQPRRKSQHLQVLEEDSLGSHIARSDGGWSLRSLSPAPKSNPARPSREVSPDQSLDLSPAPPDEPTPKTGKPSQPKEKLAQRSPKSAQGAFSSMRQSGKYKSNILSQVFEASKFKTKPEPLYIPTPRIPSVEAWLSETPDPFMDGDEPPVEIPAPLKSTSRRRREAIESAVEETNDARETQYALNSPRDTVTSSRRRRRVRGSTICKDNPFPERIYTDSPLESSISGSIPAAKLVDLVQEPAAQPVEKPKEPLTDSLNPPLRRRGAKRNSPSPTKEPRRSSRREKTPSEEEELASLVSSVNTVSSVEPIDPSTPLRPPGLNIKRRAPFLGRHRLSTIASVETFGSRFQDGNQEPTAPVIEGKDLPEPPADGDDFSMSEARDQFDPNALERRQSKNRLAKHDDLISVLSISRAGNGSIQSARSIRTNRSKLATATIEDLMEEFASDESKYMRELRTLVDGVIPVLLTCVLSKSDSAVAAGLFSPTTTARNDPNFTRPIVDMGVALERLKTLHKRAPQQDPDALLTWAQGAQKVYSEYLTAWRIGFQDVVVNLAPAADGINAKSGPSSVNGDEFDGGLPRNEAGDIINSDGERVDVAFLLKRPLVRLKYLAKTLKGINFVKPTAEADRLALKYQNLVVNARNRSNEERARLEDEAAAAIDPTRSRDPRTLGPIAGVRIDKTRRVRARDYFNLALRHSNGQSIDCRVELLLRDDAPDVGPNGDLLICEVDGTGRWLLFPPVQKGRFSARNGDLKGEIVVMVRGFNNNASEWHELLSLRSDEEQVGFEWVQMLGLTPVPPKIERTRSFVSRQDRKRPHSITLSADKDLPLAPPASPDTPATPSKSRTPSLREIDVPIGEKASIISRFWTDSPFSKDQKSASPTTPAARERTRLQKKTPESPAFAQTEIPSPLSEVNDRQSLPSQRAGARRSYHEAPSPTSLNEALSLAGSPDSGLRRARAKRLSRQTDELPNSPKMPSGLYLDDDVQRPSRETFTPPPIQKNEPSLRHSPSLRLPDLSSLESHKPAVIQKDYARPSYNRSRSSVPSKELPIIPKLRKESPPPTPVHEPVEKLDWHSPMAESKDLWQDTDKSLRRQSREVPSKSGKPPPPPLHRSPSPVQLKSAQTPKLASSTPRKPQRRSSSPLKHEYEPSTASESSSDSDASTVERNGTTSMTDSSDDEELEDGDAPTPLLQLGSLQRIQKPLSTTPPRSLYSLPNGTLSPSQSASQAPYKTVPSQPSKASKTIASIFFWSNDEGSWKSLYPDECSIVITPGLIEAFEMSAAHSRDQRSLQHNNEHETRSYVSGLSLGEAEELSAVRPLIALEVTPLVQIRHGTAVDITVRSPPTEASTLSISSNNIMFRSRNPEECEALYGLINHARINNPTFIALQNARAISSFNPSFDRSNSTRGHSRRTSWFGLGGRASYRASSAPTPSIAISDSSIGTMASAFSALKRFGNGGSRFSISRSTVTSRTGSRANSIYTSSDNSTGTTGSGTSSPIPGGAAANAGEEVKDASNAPIGLSNAKIRLYYRETQTKWRDFGSARLTIMRPTNASHPPIVAGQVKPGADAKRIMIIGKATGETLLDVTLGEQCFERTARTGIAVKYWEAFEGGVVAKEGGVVAGSSRTWMIQMKSEAETAYTFSIVGKLRY